MPPAHAPRAGRAGARADGRAGARAGGRPPRGDASIATLQLAIARDGVGLELSAPVEFGAARLIAARSRMIGIGFPVDVSGGVDRFRHRRTELEEAIVAVDQGPAERWLSSVAIGLVDAGSAEARIGWVPPPEVGRSGTPNAWEREERVVWGAGNVRIELATDDAIVACDLAIAAVGSGLAAIGHRVRAIGGLRAPTAVVGAFLARIARVLGGRARGLRVDLSDPIGPAIVEAFAVRGARVPTRGDLVVTTQRVDPESFLVTLRRGGTPAAPSAVFVALEELDRFVGEADAALVAGDHEQAREGYLRALERAPRHRAILARLAELDAHGGRPEAALSWLRDASGRAVRGHDGNDLGRGLLAAELHERTFQSGRARAAWERAARGAQERGETRLAARAWSRAAALTADGDPQLPALLDAALSCDPAGTTARWRRARLSILDGDDDRALEDVQHLEAQARGREPRRRTLMRAAALWLEAGRPDRAVPAWERALRHVPDDREIVAGLGRALLAGGETARGISLLARAAALPGDEHGRIEIVLSLAHGLAEHVGDLPAAIARLREIPRDGAHAAHASALEGACLLAIGDRIGGERAYARAADLVERRLVPAESVGPVRELLVGAAKVARGEGRIALAGRLARAALALSPFDEDLRALAASLGRDDGRDETEARDEEPLTDPGLVPAAPRTIDPVFAFADPEGRRPTPPPSIKPPEPRRDLAEIDWSGAPALAGIFDDLGAASEASADDEARAETLLSRVKADPNDEASVLELTDLLGRLGRDAELFALLSARWEEATDAERVSMAPRQREVLERLAAAAERSGKALEASLYRDAIAMLPTR
jgi:tetratricopeptide (TPR) repeat protein